MAQVPTCGCGGTSVGGGTCASAVVNTGFCRADNGSPLLVITVVSCDGSTSSTQVTDLSTGLPFVGDVVECSEISGATREAVTQTVCGLDGGVYRQLTQVLLVSTVDGSIILVYYVDANGAIVTPGLTETFTVGDCSLPLILEAVDGLEACCAETNVKLDEIITNTSTTGTSLTSIEDILIQIDGNTDGLEACCAATNTTLSSILTSVDGLEACCAASNVVLGNVLLSVDGLEACCAATNVTLGSILLSVDGLEALISATNVALATSNTTLASILLSVDGLEACCAASNTVLGSILLAVDGLEACCASTNTVLGSILLAVDGLEALIASTNTKLDTLITQTDGIEGSLTTIANSTKLEDDPHANGDRGSFALGVRNDTNAVRTSADGDYSPISVDDAGRIKLAASKNEDAPHASGDTGFAVWGVRNDAAAVLTSADGDYSPIATDSAGRIGISTLGGTIPVSIAPATIGGLSIYKNLDVNATGQNIKASSGQIYTITANNRSNAERFLKVYNKATAPIVGTDIPVMTLPLDGKTGGGQTNVEIEISPGFAFSLGIGIAATTGIADANTGNPSVNDVVATIGYK